MIKVIKIKELVELHNYDLEQMHDTKKIYRLIRVIDVNGNTVTSTNNGNIEIDPDGSGLFKIKGNSTAGSGSLTLNCELNSHGIKLQGPPHSAGASYTLTFPDNDGNADQVIKSDGSGNLAFVDQIKTIQKNGEIKYQAMYRVEA